MNEILISYIEDLRESIVTFNEALINVQNGSRDAEVVNNIFRVAHTIKGNSAAMSFTKIQSVMHTMEDLLAEVRSGARELTDDLVEVLFACHDFLEDSLDVVEKESSDASMNNDKLLARLTELRDGVAAPVPAPNTAAAVAKPGENSDSNSNANVNVNVEDIDLNVDMPIDLWELLDKNIQEGGYQAYRLEIKFLKDSGMKAVRAWMIFDRIDHSSILIYSNPPKIGENNFSTTGETPFESDSITAVILSETEISDLLSDLRDMADLESVEANKIKNEDIQAKIKYVNEQKKSYRRYA